VAAAGQVEFKPVDVATAAKDLQTLNKQFDLAVARSKSLRASLKATGQAGKSIQHIDFTKLAVDPHAAQRMRDKAFGYAAKGTAWDMQNFAPVTPPDPTKPPLRPPPNPRRTERAGGFFSRASSAFSNGVGGGFGQIANGAIKGAEAGAAEGGGAAGGAAGLLREG